MQLKEISFEIIQRCPNSCIYCSSNSNCNSTHIIDFDIFKRAIDDAIEMGLERLCISGGEPFLHPDIIKFVQYSKSQGLAVFIYSSGISFDSNNNYIHLNMQVLKQLKEIGLDKLIFNVQAADEESYNRIMKTEHCFELMKTSIRNSVQCDLYGEIHFVPMRINYRKINSVLELARELGVKKVSFLRLVMQGRARENRHLVELTKEMIEELKVTLSSIQKNNKDLEIRVGIPLANESNYGCNASSGKLIIRYDGAVFPCEAFKYISTINGSKDVKPDNIKLRSLKDIYDNSEFLNILRTEIKNFKSQKLGCESCPAQYRLNKVISQ